jgi:hypothetical protein
MTPNTEFSADDSIPIHLWGRDHWSMLAYFRSVEVDFDGFTVKFDPRMRQNRRHFRVLGGDKRNGLPMTPENGSRLTDDTFIPGHDDWNCVEDFSAAGLLIDGCGDIENGEVLHLSPLGEALVEAVEAHKARGGTFSQFKCHGIGTLTVELVRDGKVIESKVTQRPTVENGVPGAIP